MMVTLVLALLIGCGQKEDECSAERACSLGSTCVDGTCVEQECSTSDQCPIETYCSPRRTCEAGCEADNDCRFGDGCDVETKTCQTGECLDTHVDCGFGQFCSQAGECYDAGGYYCQPCNDDGDCGGNGSYSENMCLSGGCGVYCTTTTDCPSGYTCSPVVDLAGNVVSHQCYTACSVFE